MIDTVEAAIRSALVAAPAVSAVVGSRVHPFIVPDDGDFPAITYQRTSGEVELGMQGPTGFQHVFLAIACWAVREDDGTPHPKGAAQALLQKVTDALNGYAGEFDGITIASVTAGNDRDIPPDIEAGVWGASRDFEIWAYKSP